MGLLHLPVKMLQESVMGPVLLNTFINDLERQRSANSLGLQVTPNWGNSGYTQEQGCHPKGLSLEEWADRKITKFDKDKCKMLQPRK